MAVTSFLQGIDCGSDFGCVNRLTRGFHQNVRSAMQILHAADGDGSV